MRRKLLESPDIYDNEYLVIICYYCYLYESRYQDYFYCRYMPYRVYTRLYSVDKIHKTQTHTRPANYVLSYQFLLRLLFFIQGDSFIYINAFERIRTNVQILHRHTDYTYTWKTFVYSNTYVYTKTFFVCTGLSRRFFLLEIYYDFVLVPLSSSAFFLLLFFLFFFLFFFLSFSFLYAHLPLFFNTPLQRTVGLFFCRASSCQTRISNN